MATKNLFESTILVIHHLLIESEPLTGNSFFGHKTNFFFYQ